MVSEVHRQDYEPPPSPDEGYWAAILEEGENSGPVFDKQEGRQTSAYDGVGQSDTDFFKPRNMTPLPMTGQKLLKSTNAMKWSN